MYKWTSGTWEAICRLLQFPSFQGDIILHGRKTQEVGGTEETVLVPRSSQAFCLGSFMDSWEWCGLFMACDLCPFLPRGPQVLLTSPAVVHHPRTWESIATLKEQVCLMVYTWEPISTPWEFTFGRTPDQEYIWVLMGCGPRRLWVRLFRGCLTDQLLKYQPSDQSVTSL